MKTSMKMDQGTLEDIVKTFVNKAMAMPEDFAVFGEDSRDDKAAANELYKALEPYLKTDIPSVVLILQVLARLTHSHSHFQMVRALLHKYNAVSELVVKALAGKNVPTEAQLEETHNRIRELCVIAGYPLKENE